MELQQSSLCTDVTSLLLFKNHILSGMGGILTMFDANSLEYIAKIAVFDDSRIHGICEGLCNSFVAFGGYRISVISCNIDRSKKLCIESSWHLDDWIQSVKWLEDSSLAVATSHNRVTLWDWKKKECLVMSHCKEKCIVYCATFVGNSWDHLVLLVGTVFSEVVIWSPVESSKTDLDCSVLHRLQGHKGVIFSIHFNSENCQIHSTSDDRSIRGWQMNPSGSNNWKLATFEPIYILYGHTARVWKSIRLKNCTLSVGEDSLICVWSSEGKLIKQWSMHQGGNIWSLACCEEKNLLVTGGSDGAINALPLDTSINSHDTLYDLPIHEWCSAILKEQCIPRRVAILRSGNLISILESGHLVLCPAEKNNLILHKEQACSETQHVTYNDISLNIWHRVNMLPWILAYYSPQLVSYCLLEVSKDEGLVALASLNGQLLIFKEETNESSEAVPLVKIIDISACTGKIFSLQWLSSSTILTCEASGKLTLWSLEKRQDSSYHLTRFKTFLLPHCKERWVTAALCFDKFLVCGDRLGSIHFYSLESEENEIIEPCQTLFKVHGRFGVSSFMLHRNIIFSTGRDGTLQQYEISKKGCALELICATKMLFDWVASACRYANDILILGFSEKKFVVWSQQQQRLLFEVPCGGGHRSWDYLVKENTLTFVHIKHKSLCVAFCDLGILLKPQLQAGFHAKEVNCLHTLQFKRKFPLFISGGEDTTIRLTLLNSKKQFSTLVVLHSHISSIKALTYFTEGENVIIFSAGGRAQIKAWKLTYEEIADEHSSSILCRELSSHMLMDDNYKQSKSWKVHSTNVDPETRYMSLCVIPHKKIFVAVGCSDGYFRLFQLHMDSQKFQLVNCFGFHRRCILNIIAIAPLKIATMATDGIIAFWDLKSTLNCHLSSTSGGGNFLSDSEASDHVCIPFATFQIHQSGINCCALKVLESDHILLASGGDDTALVLTVYKLQDNPVSACVVQQWRMESAHVAQITGVAFMDEYVISTSVDQYIFKWKWTCDIERQLLLVNRVAEYYSTISDIHGLSVWGSRDDCFLVVYGKGMEVIEAKLMSNKDNI